MIYRACFGGKPAGCCQEWYLDPNLQVNWSSQLLHTCRKVYNEAVNVLYQDHSFRTFADSRLLESFLDKIGTANAKSIRHLIIHLVPAGHPSYLDRWISDYVNAITNNKDRIGIMSDVQPSDWLV
jgi:hypothetical protein